MKIQTLLCAQGALASSLSKEWDYIVVGSGPSGITLADRLSESGKSVLLLERGWASSGRWGGTWKPSWLSGTNLTRFDVPALAQLVWQPGFDNHGIFCDDAPSPAGCLLGGGTAINAGQFYLPTSDDFDWNQPPGFRSGDMKSALRKAKERLPWTDTPSKDGKSYLTNGTKIVYDAITNSSKSGHFRFITANNDLTDRNRVSSNTEYFFLNGEKGGPMATYLVTASNRRNFRLQLNTTVARVIRDKDVAVGVQVESTGPGGLSGTIKVTPGTGRVILSAGVFGTFKILLRSGIGPEDQLSLLANHSTEASKLPSRKDWLKLPVGHNLDDGSNLAMAISVPDLEYYPWEQLWNSSRENPDIQKYLKYRSGPLAQLQPSIGPVSWDTVAGADGKKRVVQWDAGSGQINFLPGNGGYISFTSNLNLGHTSRGRLSINPDARLSVNISKTPYFNDVGDNDFKAVLTSATNLFSLIKDIPGTSVVYPEPGQTLEDFLRSQKPASNNHWVGSTKMGSSCKNQDSVVDTTTTICGTKNLHVVDAGIVNGLPTANPQATFIVMAERAAEVILGLRRHL